MSRNPDVPLISPTLMQFTGLHDKNGKEIYEGDVLYCEGYDNVIVKWDDKGGWHPFINKFPVHNVMTSACSLSIIGNIYENPELLNQ